MTVDAKTTTAGVVVLLLSGSSSYVITNSVKGSSEETNSNHLRNQGGSVKNGTSIEGKIKEFNFELIKEKDDASEKWTALKNEINKGKTSGQITETELKNWCDQNLNSSYTNPPSEEFKEAVKKCTTLITFKERAKTFKIELIEEITENTPWQGRFDKLTQVKVKEILNKSAESFSLINGNATKDNLKDFCEKVGKLNWTKFEGKTITLEEEWSNYLISCSKIENTKKDFWTGN